MKQSYTLAEINTVAQTILPEIQSKIILLYGGMGTGKTTFTKALVGALGSSDIVSSPTFSIVNEYATPSSRIFHFDLYRVADLEAAFDFGIEDYLYTNHWCIIEWPQIIEPLLPSGFDRIDLNMEANRARVLTLSHF